MIDFSIKNVSKIPVKKLPEFFQKTYIASEKFDGTKLTITRNDQEYDPSDYTKNWIISYKGMILHPEECVPDKIKTIRKESIGISQYTLVHKHIKKIHKKCEDIPEKTEFFVEFIQRKPTLTREYKKFHELYLIGFAYNVKYKIDDFSYSSTVTDVISLTSLKYNDMCIKMNFSCVPVLYVGKFHYNRLNFPESLKNLSQTFLNFKSTLGDKPEGVVLQSDKEIYKIVQEDQYDKKVRESRKNKYRLSDETLENEYWEKVQKSARLWVTYVRNKLNITENRQILFMLREIIYSRRPKVLHSKKTVLQRQDDIFLTSKLYLSYMDLVGFNTKKLGLIPIGGYPIHKGHWNLIEKASKENDMTILFKSNKGRQKNSEVSISEKNTIKMNSIYQKYLPTNVKIIEGNPWQKLKHFLDISLNYKNLPKMTVYSGDKDVELWTSFNETLMKKKYEHLNDFISVQEVSTSTVKISGSEMREFLSDELYDKFNENLPDILTTSDKHKIIELFEVPI